MRCTGNVRLYMHIYYIPIVTKFSVSCVSLVKSVSCEFDEIRLSPSHQCEGEIMHNSRVNNEKKSRAPCVNMRPLDS